MDLNTTPAMAAPPGEVTNFHPGITEIQTKFITVYVGTLAGATVCLALRIWTRARIVRGIWADDCKQIRIRKEDRSLTDAIDAIIGAWLMDIGFFISCVEWMKYGFGDHLWNVSLAQLVKYGEFSERPYIASSLINTFFSGSNSSRYFILLGADAHQVFHTHAVRLESFPVPFELILNFPRYLRLNPQKWFRWAVGFLMLTIFVYTIATTVVVGAGCKRTDPAKTQCINNLELAQGALNIASDFFVIVLPLPMCYALHIPKGQKIALALILAAGSL